MLKPPFKIFLLILLLVNSLNAYSLIELDPLKFEHLTTQQGLSHNRINHLSQDKFGYVWIATDAGINRYDGQNITKINLISTNLQQQNIYATTRDRQNNLWIAGDNGLMGINALTGKTSLIQFPKEFNQSHSSSRIIGVESIKEQLLVISQKGVFYFNPKSRDIQLPIEQEVFFESDGIIAYARNKQILWLATKQLIYQFNIQTQSVKAVALEGLTGQLKILQLKVTSDSRLIIATNQGLYLAEPKKNSSLTKLHDKLTGAMSLNDNNRLIYFTSGDWLLELDLSSYQSRRLISISNNLLKQASDKIKSLFFDQQKRLWMATESNGIFIWNTRSIQEYPLNLPSEVLNKQSIRSFSVSSDSSMWIASDKALLHLSSDLKLLNLINFKDLGLDLRNDQFFSMHSDNESVWLYTSSGVKRYNIEEKSIRFFHFPN
ncbi:MAG: two-component regulator propeller domain-containing protein [Enterobacterales bacterium]|nr:two-component regulator propeller domain-containing protein [Enterobacterales bacterium]